MASKPPQVGQVYEPGGKPMRFSTWCSTWNEWASKAKLVEAKDGTANPEA